MKTRRSKLILAFAASAMLAVGVVAYRGLTFSWEARWVQRATSLTFANRQLGEQEVLVGDQLRQYLGQLTADNGADWGLRSILDEHEGAITIGGKRYPVQRLECKFEGESLLVQTPWKTLTLFRRDG